jgi:Domain of unknown function (DUF929)
MSKRPPASRSTAPRSSGSATDANGKNMSTSGSSRTSGQNGSATPQQSTAAKATGVKAGGSVSSLGSANYRARRAAELRAAAPGKRSAQQQAGERTGQRRARNVPWYRRVNFSIFATVGVVIAIVVVFVIIANRPSSTTAGNTQGTLASSSIVNDVTQVSPRVIDTVGTGGVTDPFVATQGSPPQLTGGTGKPEFLYMGAEYCPYCAAERWSMVVALSRFGTFSNLHTTTSSSTDTYPSTPTFTFYGSTYTSQYIDFASVEETTQDQNTTLQTPTAAQQQLLSTYDAPPYVNSQDAGAIPFVDVGNQYVLSGASYSPQVLQGWTHEQIAAKLSNPADAVTKGIVGTANYMTAAICVQTQNKPASVCSDKTIQSIEQQLPKGS